MRKICLLSLALLLTIALVATAAFAQSTSGDITGTVTDSTGAVVPNTTVTAVNTATNFKTSTVSNANGVYRFSNLPIGRYNVSTSATGYAVTTVQAVVELNKINTVPLVLKVGKVETVIEVSAATATVDTSTAQISNSFDAKLAENLPEASTGSGVLNLSLLAPGVTNASAMGYGTGPSVGGQRPTNNSFTLEGIDNNYKSVTGPITTVPNDAVAEFTMLQNQFSPEFGHSSGGQFNTVVKSGTNSFHGTAYEYMLNRHLNAIDPALKAGAGLTENPRFDNNRFGGSFGGPIIKNKLFFFGLGEYNPIGQASPGSTAICVPTAAGFTSLQALATAGRISATNYGVFSQYTQGLNTSGACGSTTVAGTGIPLTNVSINSPNFNNTLKTVGSIDYNISSSDQLRGRWIYNRFSQIDPTGVNLPVFFSNDINRAHTIAISEFHTFAPTLANEFRVGFNRLLQDFPVGNYTFPGLSNFPTILFDDLQSLQIGPNGNYPQGSTQNSYQVSDNISWTKGRHTLKFGGDVLRVIAPSLFVQYLRPTYEYSTLDLYLRDISPDVAGERGFTAGSAKYYGNNWNYSVFANDQFKATKNLTLNLGLRYEYSTLPTGAAAQTLNAVNNVPGLITFGKPQMPTKNFMPRVGFAYSPGTNGTTSIRGGFGLTYDIVFDNLFQNSLPQQFQYTSNVDLTALTPNFLKNGGITQGGTAPDEKSITSELIPNVIKDPYTTNWNLGVQHVFANIWTLDAEYVGNHTIHMPLQTRINILSPVDATHFLPTYIGVTPTTAQLNALTTTLTGLQTRFNNPTGVAGFIDPVYAAAGFTSIGGITSEIPAGNSSYNALQTSLRRRFTNGLQLSANWTWSHNLSNSDAMLNTTALNPRRPQDFRNLKSEYANSLLDRRHRVVIQALYDLPFFKNSNGFLKNTLGGWQFSPTYTIESPQFATIQSAQDANLNGDAAGDRVIYNPAGVAGTGMTVQPLLNTAGQTVAYQAGVKNADGSFTPCASAAACGQYIVAGPGALPNVGRNTLSLPRTDNINMGMSKIVRVGERMSFQFTAQAYNLFNHPQYLAGNLFDVGVNNNLTSYRSYVVPGGANFNHPERVFSGNPRQLLLSLKFSF